MEHHPQLHARATMAAARHAAEVNLTRVAGQVKWFDFIKGYGFITSSERSDDILLHQVSQDFNRLGPVPI